MARIVFCWELGRGFGHLLPHRDLVRRLCERGDEVIFLAKEASRAEQTFRTLPVAVHTLEHGATAPARRLRRADSFPEVLFNCGFDDIDKLHARIARTLTLVGELSPDLLICDFAPSVMLVNRILKCPAITVGSGFCVPPRTTPMPRFRYWLGGAPDKLFDNERRVLSNINEVLARCGGARLNEFAGLLASDREWLYTFAELDFYSARHDPAYFGTFAASDYGAPPRWPETAAPKIFAYLAPGATTPLALDALASLDVAVCLYAPSLDDAHRRRLDPARFYVHDTPVSMAAVTAECTMFVNNGNLSTIAIGLLSGKPQLCLPRAAEQFMNARRVELLGAGLAAPQLAPGDIAAKVRALLADPAYARAAGRFAEKYASTNTEQRTTRMLRDVDAVLAGSGS